MFVLLVGVSNMTTVLVLHVIFNCSSPPSSVNSRVLEGVLIAGGSPTEVKPCSRPPLSTGKCLSPCLLPYFQPACRTPVSFSLSRCFTLGCTKHWNLQNHIFFPLFFYCRDLPSACNEDKVLSQYGDECLNINGTQVFSAHFFLAPGQSYTRDSFSGELKTKGGDRLFFLFFSFFLGR